MAHNCRETGTSTGRGDDVRDDSGQIGFVKLLVGLAIVGLVLFEAGAVIVNHVQLDTLSERVAQAAASGHAARPARDLSGARQAAEAAVVAHPAARVDDVHLLPDGRVAVVVTQEANVLVLDRLGPLSDLASATATRSAPVR
jgi:hypothetical protein